MIDLHLDSAADGGACVGRTDGQVVFARHGLPGESVQVDVTARAKRFLRGDVVEVAQPHPQRVASPCPYFHPGGCGGCAWLHSDPAYQLALKAQVLTATLQRLGGLAWPADVRSIGPLLGWRTRVTLHVDEQGRAGFHPVASHDVIAVNHCPQADPALDLDELLARRWTPGGTVHVSLSEAGRSVIDGARRWGPDEHVHTVLSRRFTRPVEGFWQSHRDAAAVLAQQVLNLADPAERVVDLYAGVGLFGLTLTDAMPDAAVTLVEGDKQAAAHARGNADDRARVLALDVRRWRPQPCDLVVLDPPRAGAGRDVVRAIAEAAPAQIIYVSCDPATLARDLKWFAGHGYQVEHLEGFDLFPGTAHIETVVRLGRAHT